MGKITIEVKGEEYRCELSCGAVKEFKAETGKELSELSDTGLCDMIDLMWCCLLRCSRADGVELPFDKEGFADNTTPDLLAPWALAAFERYAGAATGSKKKASL